MDYRNIQRDRELNMHKPVMEGIEQVIHRGSPFQRKELLRTLGKVVSNLPLDEFEVFMQEVFLWQGIKMQTSEEMQELAEDVVDSVPVGSEFVDQQ